MSKKKLYNSGIIYSTNPDLNLKSEPAEEKETLPVSKQTLLITLDKKNRGGKKVTLISGFEGKDEDLESLSKQIKSLCGTGGTVKKNEIVIQGDNRAKIYDWLQKNGYIKSKIR